MPGFKEIGLAGLGIAVTGGVVYAVWNYWSSRQRESPQRDEDRTKPDERPRVASEVKSPKKHVLVLGLDGAGKTSLLHCLATGTLRRSILPTEGFNAVCLNTDKEQMEFLEIGGKESLRPYWHKYLSNAHVLVYVVDSADSARFPEAKKHLHQLISKDCHLPLVVLVNKQDLPGACGIAELHGALSLSETGDERKLFIIGTRISSSDSEVPSSVRDARELITQLVAESR